MLFRAEAMFVENLFNAIDYLGVEMLPTDIAFSGGAVAKLKDYMAKEMPLEYDEICSLFAKQNLSGDYARFRWAVADGQRVSVPSSTSSIMYINKRTENPDERYIGLAKKFCEFAAVEI